MSFPAPRDYLSEQIVPGFVSTVLSGPQMCLSYIQIIYDMNSLTFLYLTFFCHFHGTTFPIFIYLHRNMDSFMLMLISFS